MPVSAVPVTTAQSNAGSQLASKAMTKQAASASAAVRKKSSSKRSTHEAIDLEAASILFSLSRTASTTSPTSPEVKTEASDVSHPLPWAHQYIQWHQPWWHHSTSQDAGSAIARIALPLCLQFDNSGAASMVGSDDDDGASQQRSSRVNRLLTEFSACMWDFFERNDLTSGTGLALLNRDEVVQRLIVPATVVLQLQAARQHQARQRVPSSSGTAHQPKQEDSAHSCGTQAVDHIDDDGVNADTQAKQLQYFQENQLYAMSRSQFRTFLRQFDGGVQEELKKMRRRAGHRMAKRRQRARQRRKESNSEARQQAAVLRGHLKAVIKHLETVLVASLVASDA
ncbi:hypothetical protein PTSG_03556 [Salpingoeca rosetta]|uniref:Uncharacterized protein n=1 Tax=Salpingoeca rosetta (strain ATCC 50818 / BSB-021) TaxID=946362 RepID=F2U5Y2_SALR5|nr:uncharacterized protein PTSG_03556 [Salpingoeca rosetta]EGD82923.1 hypothetical protein PTSG_03556 [Salpingoeca rosetta]|eukprot:XP_004995287.1 hypothetical protein PTSG_03556 [Salpingoeca rosetta]